MDPSTLAYVTLFAPFAAAIVITLFTQRAKMLSGFIATGSIVAGLVCSVLMAMEALKSGADPVVHEIVWLEAGSVKLMFGVTIDALSVVMSLIVGIVGTAVFVYSMGYMKGEDGYSRYFACLSLFAFSMLGIVFSTNLAQTFIFWELVGVSSYSLIGYYFGKHSAVDAGKKAFLTNRIGDFGMTVGILLLFYTLHEAEGVAATLSFTELSGLYLTPGFVEAHGTTLGWAALLIFTGAVAKSAQVPLHVWLPDAMEGPTPVSALMHAATMVAAGVYLVARMFFMFAPYEFALEIVAWMGGITALLAAGIAFVQFDIKKVLAYSTLSQLGYMVMAMGLGAPGAAMFHLTTHAFFKALLFLGAGSVIHGCHHEQDMRNMGGLFGKMKITAITFWIGSLALAGFPGLAGFWSKDAILGAAYTSHTSGHMILLAVGILVALMTACYSFRAVFMTFHGEYRGHAHPHESPISMTLPLMGLAGLAAFAGYFSMPAFKEQAVSGGFLEGRLLGLDGTGGAITHRLKDGVLEPFHLEVMHWDIAGYGTAAMAIGLFLAWYFYGARKGDPAAVASKIRPLHSLLVNKYYFDDFYAWLVQGVQQRFARFCAWFEQSLLIEIIVNGVAHIHHWFGRQIRLLLDGHLHRYVTLAMLGTIVILGYLWMGNN